MINPERRTYEYYRYSDEPDAYGQKDIIKDENGEPVVQGTTNMSIFPNITTIVDDVRFKETEYIGLTNDSFVDDSFVIVYGEELLKVKYVIPRGRYRQVLMTNR